MQFEKVALVVITISPFLLIFNSPSISYLQVVFDDEDADEDEEEESSLLGRLNVERSVDASARERSKWFAMKMTRRSGRTKGSKRYRWWTTAPRLWCVSLIYEAMRQRADRDIVLEELTREREREIEAFRSCFPSR